MGPAFSLNEDEGFKCLGMLYFNVLLHNCSIMIDEISPLRVVFNPLSKVNLVSILESGYYVSIEVVGILKRTSQHQP